MKKGKTSLWTRYFTLLILMNLCNGIAGQMTIPLVAKFSLSLYPDITLASTAAGLMSLVSLVVCPFAGLLSDRLDRKKILFAASVGYGVSLLLHACVANIAILILLRLMTGVFFSVVTVTVVAFSTAFIPKERLGEGLGYTALAMILAQALGPAFGLKLMEAFSYSATFITSGLFALGCAALLLLIPSRFEPKSGQRRKVTFSDLFAVKMTGFMLLAALFSSGSGLISTYLAILAEERSIANVAVYFTLYSVCLVVLRPLAGKLLDQKGVYLILVPSIVFAALEMFFVGIGYSLSVILIGSVCKALGQGIGIPSMQAHAVKQMDKAHAGVATSTIMIGQNVGNALAPIAGSFFVTSFGYEKMFCGFGAILLIAGMVILFLQHRQERAADRNSC